MGHNSISAGKVTHAPVAGIFSVIGFQEAQRVFRLGPIYLWIWRTSACAHLCVFTLLVWKEKEKRFMVLFKFPDAETSDAVSLKPCGSRRGGGGVKSACSVLIENLN